MPALGEMTGIIIFALSATTIVLYNFQWWHVVHEGNIGFYYQFGKMMDSMTEPGLHFKWPSPITSAIQVYVRPQVDSVSCHHVDLYTPFVDVVVKNVKCGAKDGTNIEFPSIEIGNTLPVERAHAVVKQYGADYDQFLVFKQVQYVTNGLCSQFSSHEIAIEKFNELDDHIKSQLEEIQSDLDTGLEIGFVRIAKPRLPDHLSDAYQRQAKERALKKAKEEEFKRIQQENLNEQEKVRGQNERDLLYAQKENDVNTARKQAEQQQAAIENQMALEAAKTKAEAIQLEATANAALLTPEYLELKKYEAITSNSKLIFGEIPQNVFLNGDRDGVKAVAANQGKKSEL